MFRKTREKSPYYLLAMDFGYTLMAAIGVFGFLGYWLDKRYESSPWFLLAGVGLGIAVGFNGLFKRLNWLEKRQKALKKAESEAKKPKP